MQVLSGWACLCGGAPVVGRHEHHALRRLLLPEGDRPARNPVVSSLHPEPARGRGTPRRRGIVVTYETVRVWAARFGPLIARRLRCRRGPSSGIWYLDEMSS